MLVSQEGQKKIRECFALSPRETEVVVLLFNGIDGNQAIAECMHVKLNTAKVYVKSILAKTSSESKAQVIVMVLEALGLQVL